MNNTSTLTPYQAAKIVNSVLEDHDIEKILPPQMFYTYAKKGFIGTTTVDGKLRITQEGLSEWLPKYLKKNYNIDVTETVESEKSPEETVMGS